MSFDDDRDLFDPDEPSVAAQRSEQRKELARRMLAEARATLERARDAFEARP